MLQNEKRWGNLTKKLGTEKERELKSLKKLFSCKIIFIYFLDKKLGFLFFNSSRTNIFIWHGCASSELHRKLIIICTEKLLKRLVNFFQIF